MKRDKVQAGLTAPLQPGPMWSEDWPTTPGWYWFYGHTHGVLTPEPELTPVRVWVNRDGATWCVARDIMYQHAEHQSARGWWVRALIPSIANQE